MTISPNALGIVRSFAIMAGWTLLTVTLNFFMNPTNLVGLDPWISGIIIMFASGLEHAIEARTGKAMFGAVRPNVA